MTALHPEMAYILADGIDNGSAFHEISARLARRFHRELVST
jgi:hypothetical protein